MAGFLSYATKQRLSTTMKNAPTVNTRWTLPLSFGYGFEKSLEIHDRYFNTHQIIHIRKNGNGVKKQEVLLENNDQSAKELWFCSLHLQNVTSGSSSSGRATASQAVGGGFESRLPLNYLLTPYYKAPNDSVPRLLCVQLHLTPNRLYEMGRHAFLSYYCLFVLHQW